VPAQKRKTERVSPESTIPTAYQTIRRVCESHNPPMAT
jgi:hypothetical protein